MWEIKNDGRKEIKKVNKDAGLEEHDNPKWINFYNIKIKFNQNLK